MKCLYFKWKSLRDQACRNDLWKVPITRGLNTCRGDWNHIEAARQKPAPILNLGERDSVRLFKSAAS